MVGDAACKQVVVATAASCFLAEFAKETQLGHGCHRHTGCRRRRRADGRRRCSGHRGRPANVAAEEDVTSANPLVRVSVAVRQQGRRPQRHSGGTRSGEGHGRAWAWSRRCGHGFSSRSSTGVAASPSETVGGVAGPDRRHQGGGGHERRCLLLLDARGDDDAGAGATRAGDADSPCRCRLAGPSRSGGAGRTQEIEAAPRALAMALWWLFVALEERGEGTRRGGADAARARGTVLPTALYRARREERASVELDCSH